MSLKNRVVKLEAAVSEKQEPINIAMFIVEPGVEPSGYVCGDRQIFRMLGESVEDLQTRTIEAVAWPDGNSVLVFNLLEATCH